MILTHVPYQEKRSKRLYTPYAVDEHTVYIRSFDGNNYEMMLSKPDFIANFERVHEAPPPKGWDEEL